MLTDYMTAGGNEIVNLRRLQAYLESVGSPFTTGPQVCGCDTLTPSNLGAEDPEGEPVLAYTTPAADPAPWVDPAIPESTLFLGFLPLTMEGIDGSTRARSVTNAVGGGGVFGPSRELPRTIAVTGILIGASCCASDYGLHWLAEALQGCDGDSCNGSCVEMFNCCPDTVLTKEQLDAAHRRTFMRSALVSGPTVTARVGTGGSCSRGSCGMNGDILQVEFIITAASPTPWTDPIPLLDVGWPIGGTGDCVDWCLQNIDPMDCYDWDFTNSGLCVWDMTGPNPCLDIVEDPTCPPTDCIHAPCVTGADKCADPLVTVMAPPVPTAPTSPFCIPLAPEQACYSIDLSTRPEWSVDVPIITVTAGVTDLRNVGITLYGKPSGTTQTCDEIAASNRCHPLTDFFISFIPAGSSVTIDGRTGQATTDCAGECSTASNVFGGIDGGPLRFEELDCAEYCVCLTSDPNFPPGADATMSLSVSGKGY